MLYKAPMRGRGCFFLLAILYIVIDMYNSMYSVICKAPYIYMVEYVYICILVYQSNTQTQTAPRGSSSKKYFYIHSVL